MVLDLLQDFDSAQYLENKLTDLSPIFVYALILTRSRPRLLHIILRSSIPEVWALIHAIFFVPAQYLEYKLTCFHHIVYIVYMYLC